VSRSLLIALAGLIAIAAAIVLSVWTTRRDQEQQPPPSVTQPAQPTAPAKPAEASGAPSFDIVRINQQGETVIAGRAMPKAEVVILDGGKEIGRVIADNRGEWVFMPDHPLPPGSRELSLRASNPDGTTKVSDSPVVLVVPDRTKDKNAALAVKVGPDGSIEILQGPEAQEGAGPVSIAGIKYDDHGGLSVTGKADPKAQVRVYLDDRPLGGAKADDQGRWRMAAKTQLPAGNHTVRADELDADGKVKGRAEVTFARSGTLPPEGKVTVEPGNSLWRIARRAYGSGFDYLVIYQANKSQIRDPDRIYPGQVFDVPAH
jgi:LysM repeat protein